MRALKLFSLIVPFLKAAYSSPFGSGATNPFGTSGTTTPNSEILPQPTRDEPGDYPFRSRNRGIPNTTTDAWVDSFIQEITADCGTPGHGRQLNLPVDLTRIYKYNDQHMHVRAELHARPGAKYSHIYGILDWALIQRENHSQARTNDDHWTRGEGYQFEAWSTIPLRSRWGQNRPNIEMHIVSYRPSAVWAKSDAWTDRVKHRLKVLQSCLALQRPLASPAIGRRATERTADDAVIDCNESC